MRTRQSWRAPTEAERAVLDKLFTVEFYGRDEAKAQAEDCLVRPSCGCGCPSLDVKVNERHALIPDPDGEIITPESDSSDGRWLNLLPVEGCKREGAGGAGFLILLFERYGRLVELEFAPYADGMHEVPAIDDIVVYPNDPAGWVRLDVKGT